MSCKQWGQRNGFIERRLPLRITNVRVNARPVASCSAMRGSTSRAETPHKADLFRYHKRNSAGGETTFGRDMTFSMSTISLPQFDAAPSVLGGYAGLDSAYDELVRPDGVLR